MSIEILCASEIPPSLSEKWEEIRGSNTLLDSPFFAYDFFAIASQVRPNCRVGLQKDGQDIAAIFAYEQRRDTAFPVGRMFNDAHGPIVGTDNSLDWSEFWKAAELRSFQFHAMPEYCSTFQPPVYVFDRPKSYLCDLTLTPKGYLTWLYANRRTIAKQDQKTRKLTREVGTLRFDSDCSDSEILDKVIELKSQQYRRTNLFDKFSLDWIRELLHRLHRSTTSVRGQLSVLWAGEQLVAGHFGLRERNMLHYWFPVYDFDYSRYSPGTALFIHIIRACEAAGVERIDFGYGELPYKSKLCNAESRMLEGICTQSVTRRLQSQWGFHSMKLAKRLPAKETIKRTFRTFFPSVGAEDHGGE